MFVCGSSVFLPFRERSDGVSRCRLRHLSHGRPSRPSGRIQISLRMVPLRRRYPGPRLRTRLTRRPASTPSPGPRTLVQLLIGLRGKYSTSDQPTGTSCGAVHEDYQVSVRRVQILRWRSKPDRRSRTCSRRTCSTTPSCEHSGSFDVVTTLAMFEHTKDISGPWRSRQLWWRKRRAFFEVPLVGTSVDDDVRLIVARHMSYPTEPGLTYLFVLWGCRWSAPNWRLWLRSTYGRDRRARRCTTGVGG